MNHIEARAAQLAAGMALDGVISDDQAAGVAEILVVVIATIVTGSAKNEERQAAEHRRQAAVQRRLLVDEHARNEELAAKLETARELLDQRLILGGAGPGWIAWKDRTETYLQTLELQ